MKVLPIPDADRSAVEAFVAEHLGHLVSDEVAGSPAFRGGQRAADEALAAFDVDGYARHRNEVLPRSRRGASGLSPYIRHGLLPLSRVWRHVAGGPEHDVRRFRDELLWQEFARHWYARLGTKTRRGVHNELPPTASVDSASGSGGAGWNTEMACVTASVGELHRDGWLVNQARMWLASQWAVRDGLAWRDGEDEFFRHLLDGSRAANRLGWQWTTGVGSNKHYGFSRYQVERRAAALCNMCDLERWCPIEDWPDNPPLTPIDEPVELRTDPHGRWTVGPSHLVENRAADLVWLTAESLGHADPALAAHPELPVVFVFDEPLLARLRLSSKRLVFLTEALAELGETRDIALVLGDPVTELTVRNVAVTFAPVPGFRKRAEAIVPAQVYPWPWLAKPSDGAITSFSAWRRSIRVTRASRAGAGFGRRRAGNSVIMSSASLHVETIETPSLGDRTYLVHDGEVAVVVDPQRDIDRITTCAGELGVRITHVAETHLHNDYVSGGLTLAQVTGATYLHAADESLPFEHRPVHDGDAIEIGRLELEVVHTPGHTAHHLSFIITASGASPAVFTGGSLLLGTVGRTDLVSADATEKLTRAQYRSAHALADRLPDEAIIYPTHGFGSFCAAASADEDSDGTLATERVVNIALTAPSEDEFVERLLAEFDDVPSYYAHMGPLNRAGGIAIDLSPPAAVDPVDLARRIHRGEWVVDLRPRRAFAAGHLAGTVGFELADALSTYLAWLAPWGAPLTLLADDVEAIADAQRQLVRVGVDRVSGAAVGSPDTWVPDPDRRSYPVVEFRDLDTHDLPAVLDVRRSGEHEDGHLAGAVNVPIHELGARLADVPDGVVHVHCASGYRASIAASLLDRAGRDVVLIDDDFAHAADAGLPMA